MTQDRLRLHYVDFIIENLELNRGHAQVWK